MLKKVLFYSFVRKLRLPLRMEDGLSENGSAESQLQDDFQPLSADSAVQQAMRQKIARELKYNYEGEDPTPHKLVNRPSRGAVWGLGGQLMMADRKVQLQGLKSTLQHIIEFLELQQVKNIYVHDFHKENPEKPTNNRKRYHVVGSCFSARHCWKVGIEVKNAFNLYSAKNKLKRKIKYDPIYAMIVGGKAEEWIMVVYKDYEISLMTEEQREASDLEWKWNNPPAEEVVDKHMQLKIARKGRRNQFDDLD